DEIKTLEKEKNTLLAVRNTPKEQPEETIRTIKERIKTHIVDGTLQLTQGSIDSLIEKIVIEPTGHYEADVKIYLRGVGNGTFSLKRENATCTNKKTAEISTFEPDSSVNTSKKMIEAQEKQMAGK
ncbi:MAG: hypothetical protein IJL89_10460, partial [Firmicutes bacterium]|nr:hypothetical protein [Bacillota bacterium]